MPDAYPLAWPPGYPRTQAHRRERARFGKKTKTANGLDRHDQLTVAEARRRLSDELDRLNAANLTLSTNLVLNLDGTPKSQQAQPDDPGVALYFSIKGTPHCMPCDKWDRVADNIAAIAKHIEAIRGMERWGVGDVARAFAGYASLPPPGPAQIAGAPPWWDVLGVSADCRDVAVCNAAYREKAKGIDPNSESMYRLNDAIRQAREICNV